MLVPTMNVRPSSIGLTCSVWLVVLASTACTNSGKACDGAIGQCPPWETSSDCPASQAPCVLAVCDGGQCSTRPAAIGTACFVVPGDKVCDGSGRCVRCVNDSDCGPSDLDSETMCTTAST